MSQIKISKIYETMEYSPAPENTELAMEWLKNHKYKFGLFINGEWTKPKSGKYFTSKNRPLKKSGIQFSVWKPIPNQGFSAVSVVFNKGYQKPSLNEINVKSGIPLVLQCNASVGYQEPVKVRIS